MEQGGVLRPGPLDQRQIEEGHAQLQGVAHAEFVGVAQEHIGHVAAGFGEAGEQGEGRRSGGREGGEGGPPGGANFRGGGVEKRTGGRGGGGEQAGDFAVGENLALGQRNVGEVGTEAQGVGEFAGGGATRIEQAEERALHGGGKPGPAREPAGDHGQAAEGGVAAEELVGP